jgi:hypothetical protein
MNDKSQSNVEATEIRELSMEEIDATSGAGILSTIGKILKTIFGGPGDHRRPTDRPD